LTITPSSLSLRAPDVRASTNAPKDALIRLDRCYIKDQFPRRFLRPLAPGEFLSPFLLISLRFLDANVFFSACLYPSDFPVLNVRSTHFYQPLLIFHPTSPVVSKLVFSPSVLYSLRGDKAAGGSFVGFPPDIARLSPLPRTKGVFFSPRKGFLHLFSFS